MPAQDFAYTYRFGPFQYRSQIEIPPLDQVEGSGTLEITVELGNVPPDLPGAAVFDRFCRVAPKAYLLDIPGVARFLVEDGSRIRLQMAPSAPLPDVCTYLLGSVFGALCHQNGLLPLHAGAVERDGAVTAFLGESGAGKSTLVACLQQRGHRVFSDDICLLEQGENGSQVIPVAGWIKLWRQSLDHLGKPAVERNRVFAEEDKYRIYLDPVSLERPTLRNIVLLERASTADGAARLEPLSAVEMIGAMMRMTYLAYVVELTHGEAKLFQRCARVASEGKGYRLVVPWGLEHMDDVLNLLERELFS